MCKLQCRRQGRLPCSATLLLGVGALGGLSRYSYLSFLDTRDNMITSIAKLKFFQLNASTHYRESKSRKNSFGRRTKKPEAK